MHDLSSRQGVGHELGGIVGKECSEIAPHFRLLRTSRAGKQAHDQHR